MSIMWFGSGGVVMVVQYTCLSCGLVVVGR